MPCFILSTDKQVHVDIDTAQIENSHHEKLLGVTIDSKLTFEIHVQQICGKGNSKFKALVRTAPFMNI